MKNSYLPKISILLQFGGEMLALLRPNDSIQILLILSQFLTFGTETKLKSNTITLELYYGQWVNCNFARVIQACHFCNKLAKFKFMTS